MAACLALRMSSAAQLSQMCCVLLTETVCVLALLELTSRELMQCRRSQEQAPC